MCAICRKFKKGSLTTEGARRELEEQAEYLSEEHIEDIEEMLSESEEDVYDYINERQAAYKIKDRVDDDGYVDEDEELPRVDEEYDLGEDEGD